MPPPAPIVDVVIVHWNQLRGCLRTVEIFATQTVPVRITVIDNGSDPGALVILRDRLPAEVSLVELGENRGFGPGANAGLQLWLDEGSTEWAVVAPHDAIAGPDVLAAMLERIAPVPDVGLASADVGDGSTPRVDPYLGPISVSATIDDGFEDADYAHGTLLMLRRGCVADIGLFDERYFAYCEEADLGLRARAAGWRVGIVRGADVSNPEMGPGAAWIDYLQLRNTLLLLRDHYGWSHVAFRVGVAAWQTAAGLLRPAGRTAFFSVRARLLAVADMARSRYGAPPTSLSPR